MTLQWTTISILSSTKIQLPRTTKMKMLKICPEIWKTIKIFWRLFLLNSKKKRMRKCKIHHLLSIAIKVIKQLFRWPLASKILKRKMIIQSSKMQIHQMINCTSRTKSEKFNNHNKLKNKLNNLKKLKFNQLRLLQKVKKTKRRLNQRKRREVKNQPLKNWKENNPNRKLNLR